MNDCILSPTGNKKWHKTTILSMLKNEKYFECALMMKTYKTDVLSKTRIKNLGQYEQYYAENTHPAVIPMQLFKEVQEEIARRHKIRTDHLKQKGMLAVKYPFGQKIRCGCCDTQYVRGQIYTNGEMVSAWWFHSRRRSQKLCSQRGISEKSIENAFVQCLNELVSNIDEVNDILKATVTSVLVDVSLVALNSLDEEIRNLQR